MTRYAVQAFGAPLVLIVAVSSGVAQTPATRPLARSIWDGVYTDAQAQRGEQLYARHCSRCHGADLTGIPVTPLSPGAKDRTPSLIGELFDSNYNDLPLGDLVERIRISMPQERPGSLNRTATVDIVAFMLFKSGFPLGRAELTDRLDGLQEVAIVPYRR
jgi:cytochrome c